MAFFINSLNGSANKEGKGIKNNSLTKGVIWKKLLFFALPLLGTSFIQQLYNTVDLIYVGNFLGKEAAAAVGASTLFVTCRVGFYLWSDHDGDRSDWGTLFS